MRLIWAKPALADRRSIHAHIFKESRQSAARIDAVFAKATRQLVRHPEIGRIGRIPGTREWVVHPSYIIVYEIAEETLIVMAIVHTARQWPSE